MSHLRLALCQLDTVVGEVDGNAERIIDVLARVEAEGADVAAFPELAITGYPPEDLLLKPAFVADNLAALEKVAAATSACVALIGFVDVVGDEDVDDAVAHAAGCRGPWPERPPSGARHGDCAMPSPSACGGAVLGVYHKRRLPNYGVFDEERWFAPGTTDLELYLVAGMPVGVSICEDLWFPGGPVPQQGGRWCPPRGEHERVALLDRTRRLIGSPWRASGRPKRRDARSPMSTRSAVRTSWSSTAARSSWTPPAAVLAAAPRFVETTLLVDVPVSSPPRGRDPAHGAGECGAPPWRPTAGTRGGRLARRGGRGVRGPRARDP